MLKHRPTEPFWVVSKDDPTLLAVDTESVRQYLTTRDIDKLPIDLESKTVHGAPITMFRCLPLSRKAARILETSQNAAIDLIVQSHVTEVVNFKGVECVQKQDGTFHLSDKSMDVLDDDIINELATVVIEAGRGKDGETRAFSLPGTWLQDRIASLPLPAVTALVDDVTNSHSDQVPAKPQSSPSQKS